MKRIVAYDIKEGNDYSNINKMVEELKAIRLNKSVYLLILI